MVVGRRTFFIALALNHRSTKKLGGSVLATKLSAFSNGLVSDENIVILCIDNWFVNLIAAKLFVDFSVE